VPEWFQDPQAWQAIGTWFAALTSLAVAIVLVLFTHQSKELARKMAELASAEPALHVEHAKFHRGDAWIEIVVLNLGPKAVGIAFCDVGWGPEGKILHQYRGWMLQPQAGGHMIEGYGRAVFTLYLPKHDIIEPERAPLVRVTPVSGRSSERLWTTEIDTQSL
jgi:hypothetical protein